MGNICIESKPIKTIAITLTTIDIFYVLSSIYPDRVFDELHYSAVQLHCDVSDGWLVIYYLTSHLNVEVLVAASTHGTHDIITSGW